MPAWMGAGECYMFGKNQHGQLGAGHADPVAEIVPVTLPRKVAWVACGGSHTAALVELP